jgi:hypothetical protein
VGNHICATEGSGSKQYDHAIAILYVKQTKRLTFATWVLAFASVALVIATIGLIFVSIK